MTTPELTFIRLANYLDEYQLIQAGTNLCGRYYLNVYSNSIETRKCFITSKRRLSDYINDNIEIMGARKAQHALRWIMENSGSPAETMMYMQLCLPLRMGAFALNCDALNYDVQAKEYAPLFYQNDYSIDLVISKPKIGFEYDGADYHTDPVKDIRRRNELSALGWTIYPIGKQTMYNPENMYRFGMSMRKTLKLRQRLPRNWALKYEALRKSIGLPV